MTLRPTSSPSFGFVLGRRRALHLTSWGVPLLAFGGHLSLHTAHLQLM